MVVQTCLQSSQIISVQPVGWEQMEENGRVCSEWDLLCDFICIALTLRVIRCWIWWRRVGFIHSLMELYNHGGFVVRGIHWALHEFVPEIGKNWSCWEKIKEAENHTFWIAPMSQLGSIILLLDYKQTIKMHLYTKLLVKHSSILQMYK